MNCISTKGLRKNTYGEIELDENNISDNQWKCEQGCVFDWYEEVLPNKLIKAGHYLDITQEMIDIRENNVKCGYCAHKYPKEIAPTFCVHCLDSSYLEEENLHLLRLYPHSFTGRRPELSATEKEILTAAYVKARTSGHTHQNKIDEINAEYEKLVALATYERDGYLWLVNHGIPIDNCLFYDHAKKFGFGWRTPFTGEARNVLLEKLSRFPFNYDVK